MERVSPGQGAQSQQHGQACPILVETQAPGLPAPADGQCLGEMPHLVLPKPPVSPEGGRHGFHVPTSVAAREGKGARRGEGSRGSEYAPPSFKQHCSDFICLRS